MSKCFQTNRVQTAIAKWLQLPRLVLPDEIGQHVCSWSEHPLADVQDMFTLYLPTELLGTYMNVCCNYFRLECQTSSTQTICRRRNDRGLLSCDCYARHSYGLFCRHSHATSTTKIFRARAQFMAADYGAAYIDLRKGDKVVLVPSGTESEGWAHGHNLRSDQVGWFPPDFVQEW